jgi:hypothetical protein
MYTILRGNLSIYSKQDEWVKAFVLKYMYVIEEKESGMSNQASDDE